MSSDLGANIVMGLTSILGSYTFIDFADNPIWVILAIVYVLFCSVLFGLGWALIQETVIKKYDKWIGKKRSQKQQLEAS